MQTMRLMMIGCTIYLELKQTHNNRNGLLKLNNMRISQGRIQGRGGEHPKKCIRLGIKLRNNFIVPQTNLWINKFFE